MTESTIPNELPDPPPLPPIPALHDLPRESATASEQVAAQILADISKWAPAAVAAVDFMGAAELRRKLAPVATTLYRRGLSKAAGLDAQEAMRRTERVSGLTVLEGQRLGLVRPQRQGNKAPGIPTRDIGVDTKVYRVAGPSDEDFEAAIQRARDRGSVAFDVLLGCFDSTEGLTEIQRAQREQLATLAADRLSTRQIAAEMELGTRRTADLAKRYGIEIPGDVGVQRSRQIDPVRVITETIPTLDGIASAVQYLSPADVAALDAAQAHDWARQMWDALSPIMTLRAALRKRGKEA